MTDVRYAPPVADVADAANADPGPRPTQVTVAVRVLWVSFFLGIPIAIYFALENPLVMSPVMLVFGAFFIVVYRRLARGRNWARIVTTVFVLLGVIDLFVSSELPTGLWLLSRVTLVMDASAVWLLFSRESRAWFRPRVA